MKGLLKIALVTPTRGERSDFLSLCKTYMLRQTLLSNPNYVIEHFIIDYDPKSSEIDLNERYQQGLQEALNFDADLVFFIEDDDWYHEIYLETYVNLWKSNGCPDLLGVDQTVYYHLPKRKIWYLDHPGHSSMFTSAVTKKLANNIVDKRLFTSTANIFLDIYIWKFDVNKLSVNLPNHHLFLGIKHGKGLTAGMGHKGEFWKYHEDEEFEELKKIIKSDFNNYKFLTK